jgi:hypothetical protein
LRPYLAPCSQVNILAAETPRSRRSGDDGKRPKPLGSPRFERPWIRINIDRAMYISRFTEFNLDFFRAKPGDARLTDVGSQETRPDVTYGFFWGWLPCVSWMDCKNLVKLSSLTLKK